MKQKQHSFFLFFLGALFLSVLVFPAYSQQGRLNIVRDAEIESLLKDYARPLLVAAGLEGRGIHVVLVGDSRFNAFVADGQRIFMNTGTLSRAETPNEVIGVLAHEIGHLAGGHLARLRLALKRAQAVNIATALIAPGAGVKFFLTYARTEELTADRAAITYLNKTGQSALGMLKTFKRFSDAILFSSSRIDPYLQSHPMPQDRYARIETLARQSPHFNKRDSAHLQLRHDMAKAKIAAYLMRPTQVGRLYPIKDKSLPARYARAIVAFRHGNIKNALPSLDRLIKSDPKNPYFWELKGDALLESARPKDAVGSFKKAAALAPNSGLILIGYGRALVATGEKSRLNEAIRSLERGLKLDPDASLGYRFLARAYAAKGDVAQAELATAEGHFSSGRFKDAKAHAARAKKKFKAGSANWLRADDIFTYEPPRLPR